MDTIGISRIWSFCGSDKNCRPTTNTQVRKGEEYKVRNYMDLATKVAKLQFMNRDHVLLFRGQGSDHKNQDANTSLKPSLFRAASGEEANPGSNELVSRFELLERAESELAARYNLLGRERLRRYRVLRWSILQHYEVCRTPLLDVTHSLRIAASFASLSAKRNKAFVFVLGVPNLSGAITASAESGLQIVRLSSVCPPSAMRPHIQEGYLLGEYPEMGGWDQKQLYEPFEIDFGRRLVAKFYFNPKTFWTDTNFPPIQRDALYPSAANDPLHQLTTQMIHRQFRP